MKTRKKYLCENCGHICLENKRTFKSFSKRIFIVLLYSTSLFGFLGLYNLLVIGIYDNLDIAFSIGGTYATIINIASNFQSTKDKDILRDIAQNLTETCDNDYCKIKSIYYYLNNSMDRVEGGVEYRPYNVWKKKQYDCDEGSSLIMNLLKQINIKSRMQCSTNHCWLVVKLNNPKKKILLDIGLDRWKEYD